MISIITCSTDLMRYRALCANISRLLQGQPHEFTGIFDARSISEGYNRGVAQSRGEILILCHDDIEILAQDFEQLILKRLEIYDLLGIAGSTELAGPEWIDAGIPHVFGQVANYLPEKQCYEVLQWGTPAACMDSICVMDGLLLIGKRSLFEAVPFDQDTFQGFHLYDIDMTYRAASMGYKLAVCADFAVIHASRGNYDSRWREDAERFKIKHQQSIRSRPRNLWHPARVRVSDRIELLSIMRSPYWGKADR